jgi:hypothetical protein
MTAPPSRRLTAAACFVLAVCGPARPQNAASRPAPASRPAVATFDAHGRFLMRGSPVFVHGWYSDGDPGRLRRLAAAGFNAVLDYGLTARPAAATRAYLAEAERLGVMVFAAVHDVRPTAPYRTEWEGVRGNDAILAAAVDLVRASPAVVAYYVHDELGDDLLPEMRGFRARLRALDPTRPHLVVHEFPRSLGVFAETGDVFGVDHYPIPREGPAAFARYVDAARAALGPSRPLWAVPQNFGWYQHRRPQATFVAGDAPSERARLPHGDEWRANRPPTREEARALLYVALARGAQGVLWWCLYNLDFLPDRAERWDDAARLGAEVATLAPYLLATDGGFVAWSDPRILSIEKRAADGARILIAVNASDEPVRADAPWAGVGAGPHEVLFEDRRIAVGEGRLVDFFAPYARHVYRAAR